MDHENDDEDYWNYKTKVNNLFDDDDGISSGKKVIFVFTIN